jgi:hypothetical protein
MRRWLEDALPPGKRDEVVDPDGLITQIVKCLRKLRAMWLQTGDGVRRPSSCHSSPAAAYYLRGTGATPAHANVPLICCVVFDLCCVAGRLLWQSADADNEDVERGTQEAVDQGGGRVV